MPAPGAPRTAAGKPVDLAEKFATFAEHWQPRTVAEFNGHDVMVVKAQGEFVWHKHDETDDFFLVLRGERLRDERKHALQRASLRPGNGVPHDAVGAVAARRPEEE